MSARFVETDVSFTLLDIFRIGQGDSRIRVERCSVGSTGAGMKAKT